MNTFSMKAVAEAAEAGNLNMLYTLIKIDPYVLENIDKIPFVHTPLHIAAAVGHTRFATEIIRLMPSFAQKLNEEGLSPLHLAIENVDMVYRFLSVNKDLVHLKGREGLTPLHSAAASGNVPVLAVLLSAYPDSIEDFTVEGDTALHIAGKGHFDVLRVLIEWLQKYRSFQSRSRILNWKNELGDTILHVLARNNVDVETIQLLIKNGINLNVKNSEGSTALDIMETPQFANADIQNILVNANAKHGTEVTDPSSNPSLEERLKWMSQDLKAAAVAGDIEMLYKLIEIDPYVLENIDKIPFVHTPLHIAVDAGHIRFATEIIRLMPSFAHKLNEQGLSPMHRALQNMDMVRRLLSINKELVRVKGRGGLTPLHFVAINGQADILAEFLLACPNSIEDLTVKGDTALHIAADEGHFEAFQVLVAWLQRYCSSQLRSHILNRKNESGDTVLHVSARKSDVQIVQLLIENGMNLNAKNLRGTTALDILEMQPIANTVIKNKLLRAKAKRGANITDAPSLAQRLKSNLTLADIMEFHDIKRDEIDDKTRNTLLVVAVLIATMTYQSALSPPGGLYSTDASVSATSSISSDFNFTSALNNSTQGTNFKGTSILATFDFAFFCFLNTMTLLASIVQICLLLPAKSYINFPLHIALTFFWMCYLYAMWIIMPVGIIPALAVFVLEVASFILMFASRPLKNHINERLQPMLAKWNVQSMLSRGNRW